MVRTEYGRTRDSSGGVCERGVSTCRTAENKDRSREWALVSQEGERRKEGAEEGEDEKDLLDA